MSTWWFCVLNNGDLRGLGVDVVTHLRSGKAHVTEGGWVYNQSVMRCLNQSTGESFCMISLTFAEQAKWHFGESSLVWRPYSAHDSARIEAFWTYYKAGLGPKSIMVTVPGSAQYQLDFEAMTQRNCSTQMIRPLKRAVVPLAEAPETTEAAAAFEPHAGVVAAAPPAVVADAVSDVVVSPPEPPKPTPPVKRIIILRDDDATADIMPPPAARRAPLAETVGMRFIRPGPTDLALTRQRLILPSLSTSIFAFDINRAARVAAAEFAKFFARYPVSTHPHLTLCLIDYGTEVTPTILAFDAAWRTLCTQQGFVEHRLGYSLGDVASDRARGSCFAIVNAANASFSGGHSTSGFNRAVHQAAGWKELEADTKAIHPSRAVCGEAYPVALRVTSPLRLTSGVQYVIHVVGPNMNPSRSDCLYGDYELGERLLAKAYANVLNAFAVLAGL